MTTTPTPHVIADELRAHIAAEYLAGEDASDLTDDFDLIASGVIDSLGLVRLVSHIVTAYQVPVDDLELKPEHFRSITAITELIVRHSAPAAA
ncbi:acyl carrier protein [Streptomyces sp. TLI_55]|uniref:acyl carrier protein n=1 Tax=Streptomyces sp. TLI_55 TaxID=1938861 RepID=UPI000BCC7E6F|nr:phosphopantetheine-binding protein [Streptomyces sp. TLI_55]SNX62492.1 acyl carrier protein [Streptomyces sp. TLI_55]